MKTDDEKAIALKLARRKYTKKYYEANKEKVLETNRKYIHNNKESYKRKQTKYRKENSEKVKKRRDEWHKKNPNKSKEYRDKRKEQIKQYRERNKEIRKQKAKDYYLKNKEVLAKKSKDYRQRNKEKVSRWSAEYIKRRMKRDPLFKTKIILCTAVRHSFKRLRKNKSTNTQNLLGCTWEEAKSHFEKLFTEGMSWENHGKGPGKWNVDHIRPVCDWKEDELHLMNHITNLQPLWEEDNLKKSGNF